MKDCESRNPQPGETQVLRDTEVVRIMSVVEGTHGDQLLAMSQHLSGMVPADKR